MKTCIYCGCENEDNRHVCQNCNASLPTKAIQSSDGAVVVHTGRFFQNFLFGIPTFFLLIFTLGVFSANAQDLNSKKSILVFIICLLWVVGISAYIFCDKRIRVRTPKLTFSSETLTDHRTEPNTIIRWVEVTGVGLTTIGARAVLQIRLATDRAPMKSIDISLTFLARSPEDLYQLVQTYAKKAQAATATK